MFSHLVTAETAWPGSMVCDAKGISAIVNGHTACQPELARKGTVLELCQDLFD